MLGAVDTGWSQFAADHAQDVVDLFATQRTIVLVGVGLAVSVLVARRGIRAVRSMFGG